MKRTPTLVNSDALCPMWNWLLNASIPVPFPLLTNVSPILYGLGRSARTRLSCCIRDRLSVTGGSITASGCLLRVLNAGMANLAVCTSIALLCPLIRLWTRIMALMVSLGVVVLHIPLKNTYRTESLRLLMAMTVYGPFPPDMWWLMPATRFVTAIRRLLGTSFVWLTRRVTDTLCNDIRTDRTLSNGRLDMHRLSTLCLKPSPAPPLYLLMLGIRITVLFTVELPLPELLRLVNRLNRFLVRPCPRLMIEPTVALRTANSV